MPGTDVPRPKEPRNVSAPLLRSAEPRAGGGERQARKGGIGLHLIALHRRQNGCAQLCPLALTFSTLALCSAVKTRTKDKYRVVYTDHQRLELEKEFHYSRYITIRRKAELASNLGLSERQVKIWFQNRRAKERKINKKKLQQQAQPGGAEPLSPSGSLQGPAAAGAGSAGLGPAAPQ
ncbi:hypothetical protein EK904_004600 [Melospiza melodia maxima]|nr:hypothetical protein EK904_004600 [Melospiza melodia maxima]